MFRQGTVSRDWPEQGMTTETWRHIDPCVVTIADLIPTQPGILFAGLHNTRTREGGDTLPHVIEWHGNLYLEDGHHRVVRAALDGAEHMIVRKLRIA
jgi:hypothetical protein